MKEASLKNLKRWQPGQSGNPAGRPNRARLTERFVSDVTVSWEKHGASVLETMAKKAPTQFADLCSRLIPRDVSVTLQQRLPGGLEPDDWSIALSVFEAIKEALPDAGNRSPADVLTFVADAIRAHSAQLINATSEQHDSKT